MIMSVVMHSLIHKGPVMHIWAGKLTIIGSDNACRLDGTKPSSEPVLEYFKLDP